MPPFFEAILFIFLLIALGYGVAVTGILKKESSEGLTDFVFTIALPIMLFRTMTTAEFSGFSPWGIWGVYFATIAVNWPISYLVIRRVFGRDVRAGIVAGLTGSFSNLFVLGVPFMLGVFGHDGLAIVTLILSVHLPVMMAVSVVLFEWAMRADGMQTSSASAQHMVRNFIRQLFKNPLIIGIFAGIAFRMTGLSMPHLGERVVDAFAGVAGPVALFSMGMSLRRFGVSGQVSAAIAISSLKLFVMPAIALAFALLAGLPPFTAKVVVVAAALPTGANPWLIATRFGTGQRLASTAMTLGTVAAAVTTFVWLTIAEAVFG